MSKFEYTDEMTAKLHAVAKNGLTEETITALCDEFEFPRRSVTAKLRKLGYDVPKKPGQAPVFSAEETDALKSFLSANNGSLTAEEIAAKFAGGKFNARQINGKVLSLELTSAVKPAEKKVQPKTFTEAEEAVIKQLVESGAFLEDIATRLSKPVNSVRGKLLSMGLKAKQRDKKEAKKDAYDGIEAMTGKTVKEIAEHFGKTERGVKTVLTRRGLSASDYTPKADAAE
jgi:hypothetical protein